MFSFITPEILMGLFRAIIPGVVAAGVHYGLGSDADITAAATAIATGAVAAWSTYAKRPSAIIAQVNSDSMPGVKVVASTSTSPEVTEPIIAPTIKK